MPALIVLATAVYDLGTLSATVPRWCVIYVAAVLAFAWWKDCDRTDALAFGIWGYSALSLSWSLDWQQGAYSLVNMTALLLVFLWARRNGQRVPDAAVAAVLACYVLLDLYPRDFGGHGNRNFATEFIILGLCLSASLRGVRGAVWLAAVGYGVWYLGFVNESKIEWILAPLALSACLIWSWRRALPSGFWRGG